MAGWDVPAMVHEAGFYSSWSTAVRADHLVAAALDSPMGRAALLDPDATYLAVGGLRDAASGVTGGLFVTYQTLAVDAATATRAVIEQVQAARAGRGLSPLRLHADPEGRAAELAERLRIADVTPDGAMGNLIAYASRTGVGSPRGWLTDALELESVELPEGTYTAGDEPALLLVAPYRLAGDPWWRWAVIMVAQER